jgi:hypothetical protein
MPDAEGLDTMSKEPFDVTPWVLMLAGFLIGSGVYDMWGWAGEAIWFGLLLLIWAVAAMSIKRGAQ